MKLNRKYSRLLGLLLLPAITGALLTLPTFPSHGAANAEPPNPYRAGAPNVDINATAAAVRKATAAQLAAIDQFKANYGNQTTIRWNSFAGSPDVIMGFHTAPSSDTPENVARSFVAANSTLFGIDPSALVVVDKKEALGGYLIRFKQTSGGVDVSNGGVGFLMNSDKQIRMVMGSSFRGVNLGTTPSLVPAAAIVKAQLALAGYAINRSAGAEQLLKPAYDELAAQIAPALYAPKLNIFPTANGYKLAWNVITYSRNPFGVFVTQVDASNGQILARESKIRYQNPLPYTADIFPNHPTLANPDTGQFKLDATGAPEGLLRVQLRNYDPTISASGVAGLMSGPHALIKNVLAAQQPFPQAAMGTWHFRANNAPVETQPNEADDLAEPSEHFDDSNIFFFVNYLVEYITDVHRRDDAVHSRLGQGDFPDDFPNSDRPLVALPHFPSDGGALIGGGADTSGPDALLRSLLGLDNAFSLPLTQTVDTPQGPQTVIINPTVYGHGYLFNDLGKDGAVAYHEGMHSISTPIAGLEGAPEGSALNEAQADLWAYTITDAEAIGEYVVKGARARQAVRDGSLFAADTGRDPERLAWIRSVHSTLKYSHLGTRGGNSYEEHRDGEIYVATMWDLRNLLKQVEPAMNFLRPAFLNGNPTREISQGQDTFERLHLGSLYLLGLTSPDTFIKTRDAVLEADRVLYSTDPSNLDAPGQHEALIWQVFASHEIGINADTVVGGRQTISTQVPEFVWSQAQPAVPQNVVVEPASNNSLRVSWRPVPGAVAYEVFKRKIGTAGQRQFGGAPMHPYLDGDRSTTGWSHISYVVGAANYEDTGRISEFFSPTGLSSNADADGFNEMTSTEYAVRALAVNDNRQVGVSDLSAGTGVNVVSATITSSIKTTVANVQLAGGVFEFDQTLKNNGVSSVDGVAYGPIDFRIMNISDPTVTVKNADNGGNGRNDAALFRYSQSLANGATSTARHLQFNNPLGRMFTFDTVVTATLRESLNAVGVSGSQPGDGMGGVTPGEVRFETHSESYTGTLVVGAGGLMLSNGLDYVDVPFVAPQHSFGVDGSLDASPASAGALPDMDFELLDDQDQVLATSGNVGPQESLSAAIIPGRTYRYRVVGYASGPTQFVITSKQYFPTGEAPGSSASGSGSGANGSGLSVGGSGTGSPLGFLPAVRGTRPTRFVRFTFNPITRSLLSQLLN